MKNEISQLWFWPIYSLPYSHTHSYSCSCTYSHTFIPHPLHSLSHTLLLLHYRTTQGILKGKYHCTVDLLFDWFGLVCFANKNKNCQLSYSWFQTSQTGGQQCSDTSTFIPVPVLSTTLAPTLALAIPPTLASAPALMHMLLRLFSYPFTPTNANALTHALPPTIAPGVNVIKLYFFVADNEAK